MNKIKGEYQFDENYEISYTNGAIGGFNGLGDIFVNFYIEKNNLPKSFEVIVDDSNSISEAPHEPVIILNRFIEHGYVMNIETAERIIRWLQSNVDNAKKAISDRNSSEK